METKKINSLLKKLTLEQIKNVKLSVKECIYVLIWCSEDNKNLYCDPVCNKDHVSTVGGICLTRVDFIKKINKINNTPDLEYITSGLFTSFIPSSKAGEVAYNEMLQHPETPGAKIYTIHLKNMLYQLKKAGYTVKKAKKISKKEADKILNEILSDPMFN